MHPNRKKSREDYGTFRSNQLRNKIFQLMTFIEGQYAGSFDDQDMHDGDFGHLARLIDMIDAYNMNNPDNKMDYPKIRDESMRPVDWAPYLVNESRTVRITKKQLRRIIKEAYNRILTEGENKKIPALVKKYASPRRPISQAISDAIQEEPNVDHDELEMAMEDKYDEIVGF